MRLDCSPSRSESALSFDYTLTAPAPCFVIDALLVLTGSTPRIETPPLLIFAREDVACIRLGLPLEKRPPAIALVRPIEAAIAWSGRLSVPLPFAETSPVVADTYPSGYDPMRPSAVEFSIQFIRPDSGWSLGQCAYAPEYMQALPLAPDAPMETVSVSFETASLLFLKRREPALKNQ